MLKHRASSTRRRTTAMPHQQNLVMAHFELLVHQHRAARCEDSYSGSRNSTNYKTTVRGVLLTNGRGSRPDQEAPHQCCNCLTCVAIPG
jgi:hypothetical protein